MGNLQHKGTPIRKTSSFWYRGTYLERLVQVAKSVDLQLEKNCSFAIFEQDSKLVLAFQQILSNRLWSVSQSQTILKPQSSGIFRRLLKETNAQGDIILFVHLGLEHLVFKGKILAENFWNIFPENYSEIYSDKFCIDFPLVSWAVERPKCQGQTRGGTKAVREGGRKSATGLRWTSSHRPVQNLGIVDDRNMFCDIFWLFMALGGLCVMRQKPTEFVIRSSSGKPNGTKWGSPMFWGIQN